MPSPARHVPAALAELYKDLPYTLTRAEALVVMGISLRTLSRAIDAGELRVVKTAPGRGGRVVIPRAEVIRWMSARMAP